jgi:hypothetical protein
MVGAVFGALRPILAVLIVGGAATVAVAPAFDMAAQQRSGSQALSGNTKPVRHDSKPDYEKLLRLCLETRDPDSAECLEAAVASDLSFEAFRVKVVSLLDPTATPEPTKAPEPTTKPEPKPEPTVVAVKNPAPNDFEIFFKKCVDSRDLRSDPCEAAYQLSGMSSDDFDAKVRAKIEAATKTPQPVQKDGDFATWFAKCLDTRDVHSDACFRAQQLIGFSDADFKAKFDRYLAERDAQASKPTPAPKDGDFATWFNKCLDSRDVHSDACFRAQQLIGYSDADFQAKFERYLAERDAKNGKPTPQPVANLDAIFKACGQTHDWTSNACIEAHVKSGLQPAEFRAKVEAKFGAFH